MLDRNRILKDPAAAERAFRSRGLSVEMGALMDLDAEWFGAVREWEALREKRNTLSAEIGLRKRKNEPTGEIEAQVRSVNEAIGSAEEKKRALEARREEVWLSLPNIPKMSCTSELQPSSQRNYNVFLPRTE